MFILIFLLLAQDCIKYNVWTFVCYAPEYESLKLWLCLLIEWLLYQKRKKEKKKDLTNPINMFYNSKSSKYVCFKKEKSINEKQRNNCLKYIKMIFFVFGKDEYFRIIRWNKWRKKLAKIFPAWLRIPPPPEA